MRLGKWVGVAVQLLLLVGCGAGQSGQGGGGLPVFPSRARLDAIAQSTLLGTGGKEQPTVSVDSWDMAVAPAAPSPENDLLQGSSQGRRLRATPELTCAAREIGRFFATKGGMPDQQLQDHLLGQCGDAHPGHSLEFWTFDQASGASDQALLEQLRGDVAKFSASLADHPYDGGAALVRANDKAVFAAVVARRYVELAPLSNVSPDGTVVITGTLYDKVAAVHGLLTSGAHAVAPCTFDRSLRLPQFRMTCKMADGDASAWIDLQLLEPERVLSRSVLRVLARRTPEPQPFSVPPSDPSAVPTDPQSFRMNLLGVINRLRAEAGMAELRLEDRQSQQHQKLAPYFFNSAARDSGYLDDIALGLMAGWDVQGTIRDGSFYGVALSGTLSAERWLGHLLEYPGARSLIFDPDARAVAIGPMLDPHTSSLGALLSTYSFFESPDHSAERKRLIEMIAQARALAHSSPASAREEPSLKSAASQVFQGADTGAALQQAMEAIGRRDHAQVQGMLFETLSLDSVQIPNELIRASSLTYALEVTHVRHPDSAWGNLVVLIVISRPGTTSAGAGAPARG
ncbi:MAG TPA: hypothetical protein VGP93_13125 [Polyangiaceae bacterium]|nr:hypothetical protein [Polyangiaceae bacterium]